MNITDLTKVHRFCSYLYTNLLTKKKLIDSIYEGSYD